MRQALEEKAGNSSPRGRGHGAQHAHGPDGPDDLKKMGLLLTILEEDDDVQNIWHNLENEEDLDR